MWDARDIFWIPLLVAAIAMAMTLPVWAAVMQASLCGFLLGVKMARIIFGPHPSRGGER